MLKLSSGEQGSCYLQMLYEISKWFQIYIYIYIIFNNNNNYYYYIYIERDILHFYMHITYFCFWSNLPPAVFPEYLVVFMLRRSPNFIFWGFKSLRDPSRTTRLEKWRRKSCFKIQIGALCVELLHFRWKYRILVCQLDIKT